jgi:hypothetical protein
MQVLQLSQSIPWGGVIHVLYMASNIPQTFVFFDKKFRCTIRFSAKFIVVFSDAKGIVFLAGRHLGFLGAAHAHQLVGKCIAMHFAVVHLPAS